LEVIKKAREVIAAYTTNPANADPSTPLSSASKPLLGNDKDLGKLLARCKERRKAQLKREKQRAQAMFATTTAPSSRNSSEAATTTSTQHSKQNGSHKPEPSSSDASLPPLSAATTTSTNGDPSLPKAKKSPRSVTFAHDLVDDIKPKKTIHREEEEDDDEDVAWHKDPYFLGGLGFLVGVFGTMLLASQKWRRNS
jgi:hypothetical protein